MTIIYKPLYLSCAHFLYSSTEGNINIKWLQMHLQISSEKSLWGRVASALSQKLVMHCLPKTDPKWPTGRHTTQKCIAKLESTLLELECPLHEQTDREARSPRETLGMQAKSCGTTYKSINVNIIIEIVVTLLVVVAVVAVVLVVVVGIVQSRLHAPGKEACRVAGGVICTGYGMKTPQWL